MPAIRQKGQISKQVLQENKARQIFRKANFLTPWYAHVRVRIKGKKCSFFRKFGALCLMATPFLKFVFFPYCWLIITFNLAGFTYLDSSPTSLWKKKMLSNIFIFKRKLLPIFRNIGAKTPRLKKEIIVNFSIFVVGNRSVGNTCIPNFYFTLSSAKTMLSNFHDISIKSLSK